MNGTHAGPSCVRRRSGSSRSESSDSNAASDFEPGYRADEDDEEDLRSDSEVYQDAEDDHVTGEQDTKGKGRARGAAASSIPPAPPRSRVNSSSSNFAQEEKSRSWTDLNLSIIVALISPIGNWLTGSDHVKHLCLLLLLIYYLHQLIEIPWQLYHKSRTRPSVVQRLRKGVNGVEDAAYHTAAVALSELRSLELFYLGLSVLAPFLGSHLIRHIFTAMEVDSLSWFSQTLFVLATGVRPWAHLIERLQQRTNDLQDAADRPLNEERHQAVDDALAAIMSRLDSLEDTLSDIYAQTEEIEPTRVACEELNEVMGDLERFVHRHERKTELARVSHNNRLAVLETGLQRLEERSKHDALAANRALRFSAHMESHDGMHTWRKIVNAPFARMRELIESTGELILAYLPSYMLKQRPGRIRRSSSSPLSSPSSSSAHLLSVTTPMSSLSSASAPFVPYFNGTPLETIPEDSDSEGTYVSESSLLSPGSATVKLRALGRDRSGSRSRSSSLNGPRDVPDTSSSSAHFYSPKAFEFVAAVAGWPYRVAAGTLSEIMRRPT
ncbi:hypothetical protein BC835DRAFT_678827 [Cytidiella melzeri]|nr:hypothetical protein BC835DRAFT_678827 [Cytidiella melzeri]